MKKGTLRFLSCFIFVILWGITLQRSVGYECESAEVNQSTESIAAELDKDSEADPYSFDTGSVVSHSPAHPADQWDTRSNLDLLQLPADLLRHKMRQLQFSLLVHFQLPAFYLLYQTLDGYLG